VWTWLVDTCTIIILAEQSALYARVILLTKVGRSTMVSYLSSIRTSAIAQDWF